MSHYSKCLFATFAVLLLGFFAAPCRARGEGQLLHAGLLGYTGGIEDEAMLLAPAAFDQIYPGQESRKLGPLGLESWSLRFGSLSYLYLGIGATKNINDYFSFRGSVDFTSREWDPNIDLHAVTLKATALLHLPAGTLAASDLGYFNPYLGLGLAYNSFHFHTNLVEVSATDIGIEFLAGIEYVFTNNFSLGLEISVIDADLTIDDSTLNRSLIRFTVGIPF